MLIGNSGCCLTSFCHSIEELIMKSSLNVCFIYQINLETNIHGLNCQTPHDFYCKLSPFVEICVSKSSRAAVSLLRWEVAYYANAIVFLQNKATTGKQGLGIKDRPRKIAGCHFEGKKTSFDDSDDDSPADSSSSPKRKYDDSETERSDEPKPKLKKLCRQLLRQVRSLI